MKDDIAEELFPAIKAIVDQNYHEMSVPARLYRYAMLLKKENAELSRKNELYLSMLDKTRADWSRDNFNMTAEIERLNNKYDYQLLMKSNDRLIEQNKELHVRLLRFEGMTFSENSEIEQLKSDLRTSDLNRQSLWTDSLKLVDENASLQKQITALKEEIEQFKRAFES